MSICIIGAGLAGLSASIKLKLLYPKQEIVILDGFYSGSNTQIAGQRYRERASGKGNDPINEIAQLLADRNHGILTNEMKIFAKLAVDNLNFWKTFNPKEFGINLDGLVFRDNNLWFGPQLGQANKFGNGRGLSILLWFKNLAKALGVEIINAEVYAINRINDKIRNVFALIKSDSLDYVINQVDIYADYFILAGGNLGGRMFLSTNAQIYNSPQELAFDAGFSLIDSTLYMFHIAGYCNAEGIPKAGCFETDNLSGFQVYLQDNKAKNQFNLLDKETTKLFEEHKAHYYFDVIAKKFIKHGGRIMLSPSDGGCNLFARVSHHYSHIAVQTQNGVNVSNASNLFAVGDASGMGYS